MTLGEFKKITEQYSDNCEINVSKSQADAVLYSYEASSVIIINETSEDSKINESIITTIVIC